MSKIEECWVIQRDDGYFYYDYEFTKKYPYEKKPRFTKDINKVFLNYNFWNKFGCEQGIKEMQLQNCKPVKVEIKVVGEKQNQTQLAIQELEKVKIMAGDLLEKFCSSWEYHQKYMRGHRHIEYYDLIQGIDNQIKELKGE